MAAWGAQQSSALTAVVRCRASSAAAAAPQRSMMGTPGQGSQDLCLHVLFVMTKVLRVPPSNPLVWQLSLTGEPRGLWSVLAVAMFCLPCAVSAAPSLTGESHGLWSGLAVAMLCLPWCPFGCAPSRR